MSKQELEKKIAKQIIECFKKGRWVFLCGNGGSYDLARHMEEEFLCKLKEWRRPLPALALKAHTSISNDLGYEQVFARQVLAYGTKGDILLAISTSGKSLNVINAMKAAESLGMTVIDFPRNGSSTAEIQENQLILMHDICRIVEQAFL